MSVLLVEEADFNTSDDVDVQTLMIKADDYKAYALVTGTITATTKVSWTDIKAADRLKDGNLDISKLLKNDGYLVFTPDTKADAANGAKTVASLSSYAKSLTPIKLYAFGVKKLASKPTVGKPSYSGLSAAITVPEGAEWTYAEDYNGWAEVGGTTLTMPVASYKYDIWVRVAATATTAPSVYVKVSIAAAANAPSVKMDIAKGTVKAKATWLASIDDGTTWATLSSLTDIQTNGVVNVASLTSVGKWYIQFQIPSTGSKPASSVTELSLAAPKASAVSAADLVLTAKDVKVIGAKPVQAFINGKWKTVKAIKFADIEDKALKIRMAGNKTTLPGDEITVTLNKATGILS
ncbi:MAG: hypothetical protein FWH16_00950 [Oscillospiraceae bacterium]|nr:hypothetical protein [Oscillospiraceae bacterium]